MGSLGDARSRAGNHGEEKSVEIGAVLWVKTYDME